MLSDLLSISTLALVSSCLSLANGVNYGSEADVENGRYSSLIIIESKEERDGVLLWSALSVRRLSLVFMFDDCGLSLSWEQASLCTLIMVPSSNTTSDF